MAQCHPWPVRLCARGRIFRHVLWWGQFHVVGKGNAVPFGDIVEDAAGHRDLTNLYIDVNKLINKIIGNIDYSYRPIYMNEYYML